MINFFVNLQSQHTRFFISITFISNTRLKLGKVKAKQRLDFSCLKIIRILHPCYHPKIKKQTCLQSWDCTINHNENEDENKNRSQRYDINRPSSRHGHTFSKCKNYLSIMMLICIWSSIHEKVKQHRMSWKNRCLYKKVVYKQF